MSAVDALPSTRAGGELNLVAAAYALAAWLVQRRELAARKARTIIRQAIPRSLETVEGRNENRFLRSLRR